MASAEVHEPVEPSQGWGVLHLFYDVDRDLAAAEPGGAKRFVEAVERLADDGHRVHTFPILGTGADLGVMAYGPDLNRLQMFQEDLRAAPLEPAWSFVSLTELSEYTSTEDDERARLATEESLSGDALEEKLTVWRDRMAHYNEHRLHPDLPNKKLLCFYPMNKRREQGANWYELSFDERKQLMSGHAGVGRTYAGRVLQLITGATGLDDWEWGVTLLADDPVALKEIVAEMRFDPVSARYADFGPFYVGLMLDPAEAARRGADMTDHRLSERFFVSFPESLVGRPMVYEVIQRFSVVPNIRRANVEEHSGWMILELAGEVEALEEAVAWLIDVGCTVNRMEGDVVEG